MTHYVSLSLRLLLPIKSQGAQTQEISQYLPDLDVMGCGEMRWLCHLFVTQVPTGRQSHLSASSSYLRDTLGCDLIRKIPLDSKKGFRHLYQLSWSGPRRLRGH